MAIALNGGHVSRALDFYDRDSKYFIIGGSNPWKNEPSPDLPDIEDYKLKDVIGLKKVDNTFLVIPDDSGDIIYRDQNWKKVNRAITTEVGSGGVINGSNSFKVVSVEGMRIGDKLRVNNLYEGIITNIEGSTVTLDTQSPATISSGSIVQGGALVEDAKYVYIECYLSYDNFPLVTYRQIGVCTEVVVADGVLDKDILIDAAYNSKGVSDYDSLGVLEILDNRAPITRDINMRERISMIIEF